MLRPYPKQRDCINHLVSILKRSGSAAALNGSETGTGKTVCGVEVARELGVPIVVVCPKIVIPSWESTFAEQGVPYLRVINYEKLRTGRTDLGFWVRGQFNWKLPAGALVIWDEVHRAQGAFTQNSKMLIGAKLSGLRSLALSATAAEDPTELRALGYVLGLHNLTNFVTWAKARGCDFDIWRKLVFTKSASLAKSHLTTLHAELYPDRGVKLTRHDLAEHFRNCQMITDPLDFGDSGSIAKIYSRMEKEIAALNERKSTDDPESKGSALVQQLRARQEVELLKIPAIEEFTNDALAEGRSVAIFVNFDATVDSLLEKFKCPCGVVRGKQKAEDREGFVQGFQKGSLRVIILNISAGGLGVNLHDLTGNAPRTAIISPSFNAKELEQVKGRVDRSGAQSDSIQRILVAAGTIEEKIVKSVTQKIINMQTLHKAVDVPVSAEPEQAHAEYSPSSLKYREVSPRFIPRQGGNAASEKGTRIHYACETGDFSKLLDDEERFVAETLLAGVSRILASHAWEDGSYSRINEIRLTIVAGDISTFGTCDLLVTRGDEAVMIDYKTGVGAIDSAEVNLQAQCYVAGGFQKFPELNKIHFYFLVPARDEILFHTYTREDLPNLLLRINSVIRRAKEATTCNPQFGICEYCALQSTCKDLAAKMYPIAEKYSEGYVVPARIKGEDAAGPEELSDLLVLANQVGKWVDSVKDRARRAVNEDGWVLPDFSSVKIQRSPKVLSTLGAYRSLEGKMELDEFLACADLDLAKLEDFFSNRAPRGQKGKEKDKLLDSLRDSGILEEGQVSYQLRQKRK